MFRRLVFLAPLAVLAIAAPGASAAVAPVMTHPASNSVQGSNVHVAYALPYTPDPGSMYLTFYPTNSPIAHQYGLYDATSGDFTFPVANPSTSPAFYSGGGVRLPDNLYNVTLSFTVAGSPVELTNTSVRVKTATTPPNLVLPEEDSASNAMIVSYNLPDTPANNSTKLKISKVGGPVLCTLTLTNLAASTPRTFTINLANPWYLPDVVLSSSPTTCAALTDGDYTLELSYADNAGDPESSTIRTPVTLDRVTEAPTLISPASNGVYPGLIDLSYSLPELPTAGSGELEFTGPSNSVVNLSNGSAGTQGYSFNPKALFDGAHTMSVTGDPTLADGLYTVKLSYRDEVGNPMASSATATNVRIGALPVVPGDGGGGGGGGGAITRPAKQCFTATKQKTVKGKTKKKSYKFTLSGKPSADGQTVTLKLSVPKGAKATYTVDGKKVKGPRVLILLTDGAQNATVKVKYRGASKTLKLALPKAAC